MRDGQERKRDGKKGFFLRHLFDFLLIGTLAVGTGTALGLQIAWANEPVLGDLTATITFEGNLLNIDDGKGGNRNPFVLGNVTQYEEIKIRGRYTEMTIGIDHNAIAVLASGCPGQECVRQGWAKGPNHPIVCAHNGIFIEIVGGEDDVLPI